MSKDISSETSRREARITTRAPGSRGVRFGWVQALCSSAICLLFSSGVAQAQIPILNETTELTAADGAPVDFFGEFVAVDGDTIVAGAIRDDCPPGLGNTCGAAYVFIRDGAGWTQRAKLTASDAAAGDQFGSSVAVSGDTVVIGASQDDVRRGSAYVFVKPAGGWTGALTEDAKCSAPGFLDSGLKVITSTLPRPVRRNRVALGLDSDSRTSPASTARCTSVETRARRGGVPRSFRSSAPTRDSPLTCG